MGFYKVTNRYNCSIYILGRLQIQYMPNMWVKSPFAKYGYGICVFNSLQNTKFYVSDFHLISKYKSSTFRIWEIDVKHQMQLPTSLLGFDTYEMYDMITSGIMIDGTSQWPEGTLMFQEIKLLKDITNDVL